MLSLITLWAFTGFGTIDPGYLTGTYDPKGPFGTGGGLAVFIKNVLNSIYVVAGLGVFIYLVMAGFKYITAGGDAKATQEASRQITAAITGIAVIIVSYAFVSVIGAVIGVPIFKPTFRAP